MVYGLFLSNVVQYISNKMSEEKTEVKEKHEVKRDKDGNVIEEEHKVEAEQKED